MKQKTNEQVKARRSVQEPARENASTREDARLSHLLLLQLMLGLELVLVPVTLLVLLWAPRSTPCS